MNLPEAILLLCLIGWTFCVATEMRRLEAFMESRYTNHRISGLQFFAEVTGRFLLIVAATDLSILLYAAGLCAGMSSAEMYSLWPLHVFHTCGLAVVAMMRFARMYNRDGCYANRSWLDLLHDEVWNIIMFVSHCSPIEIPSAAFPSACSV